MLFKKIYQTLIPVPICIFCYLYFTISRTCIVILHCYFKDLIFNVYSWAGFHLFLYCTTPALSFGVMGWPWAMRNWTHSVKPPRAARCKGVVWLRSLHVGCVQEISQILISQIHISQILISQIRTQIEDMDNIINPNDMDHMTNPSSDRGYESHHKSDLRNTSNMISWRVLLQGTCIYTRHGRQNALNPSNYSKKQYHKGA